MSTIIDQKVVQMSFDNSDFEKNTKTTMSTIEKLKSSLNFDKTSSSLENLNKSANKVDMSVMSNALENVKLKFSAMQVMGMTALANLTNSAINAGRSIANALILAPPKDGLREYELQINSVQTIMGNTGRSVGDVNAALDKLNEYADLTIYNFAEMTQNAGMFTAAGLGLEDTMTAIKGVGNWAAFAGANTQQMTNATYQLGQALGAGSIRLQDWMSIEKSAGMAGEKYKKAFIETAREMGTGVDAAMKKYGGFRDSLRDGWLTTDVFLNTMKKFAADQSMTDAATKVKTFSQLIDTLKEALGTGWATTFRTIIGDFEEAKELFTGISNVLSGLINKSSDSRNQMLKEWKDLGGRKALVDALKNSFNVLASVLIPIKQAFRDIFPRTTANQLLSITEKIRDFIYKLQLSEEQMSKLRSIFRGMFSILGIIKEAFLGLISAMKPLSPVVGGLVSKIFDFLAKVGDFITKVYLLIKQSKLFEIIFTSITDTIANFGERFKGVINSITSWVNSKFQDFKIDIKIPKLEGIIQVFNGFKNTVLKIFNTLKEKLSPIVLPIINNIREVLSKITFKDILKTSGLAIFIAFLSKFKKQGDSFKGVIETIKNTFQGFLDTFKSASGTFEGLKGIFGQLKETLKAYQNELNSKALINIAISIAILVGALSVLSTIDSKGMTNGIVGISVVFGELAGFLSIISKMDKNLKNLGSVSRNMVLVSISILILSGTLKSLASLELSEVGKGLLGVAGLMTIVVVAMKTLSSQNKTIIKGAGSMILLAIAIKSLSKAVVTLGELDFNALTKGLLGVGALLLEISIFSRLNKANGVGLKNSAGLILLAVAIKQLTKSVETFGNMDVESMKQGLVGMGLILTELAIFSKVISGTKGMLMIGVGLVLMGTAIKSFASAVGMLGALPLENIRDGLITLGSVLAMVTMTVNTMPKNILGIGVGLVAVSLAIKMLSSSLMSLGSLSIEDLSKGLIGLGVALAEVVLAVNLANGALAGAAALTVMSIAIALLVPSIVALSLIPIGNIGKALLTLAGVFAIFGVAAAVLAPLIPAMLGLAGALTLLGLAIATFGVAIFAVGAGIAAFAAGLASIAALGGIVHETIIEMVTATLQGIAIAVPTILQTINDLFKGILQIIIDNVPLIIEAVKVVLEAILFVVKDILPKIIEIVLQLLITILKKIGEYVKPIVDAVVDLIAALLRGIADNIGKIVNAGVYLIAKFIEGILSGISKLVKVGFECIIKFVNSVADTIRTEGPRLKEAFKELFLAIVNFIGGDFLEDAVRNIGDVLTSILDKIASFGQSFFDAGKNLIQGLIDGISGFLGKAKDTVTSILPENNKGASSYKKDTKEKKKYNKKQKKANEYVISREDRRDYSKNSFRKTNKKETKVLDEKEAKKTSKKYGDGIADGIKESTPKAEKENENLLDALKRGLTDANFDMFNNTKAHDSSMLGEKTNYYDEMSRVNQGGLDEQANFNTDMSALQEEGLNNTKQANEKSAGESKKGRASKQKDQEEEIKAEDKYWKDLLEKVKNGADAEKYEHMKLKDFKKQIFDETKNLLDDYLKDYDAMVEKIASTSEFFDAVSERNSKNGNQLRGEMIENARDQADRTKEMLSYVTSIHEKVNGLDLDDNSFLAMIDEYGKKDIDRLEALAGASQTELLRMYGYYQQNYESARAIADIKMSETKATTEAKLGELLGVTGVKLEELKKIWNGKWDSLDGYVKNKLANVGENLGTSIATGLETASNSQSVKAAASKTVDNIKTAVISKAGISENKSSVFETQVGKPMVNGVVSGLKNNTETLKTEAGNLSDAVVTELKSAKQTTAYEDVGKKNVSDIETGIKNKEQDIKNTMSTTIQNVATSLDTEENKQKFITAGENFAIGIADGIRAKIREIANAAADVVKEAIKAAEEAQDSHSPSKEMIKRGAWFSEGYAIGIDESSLEAEKSAKNMAKGTIKAMSDAIAKIPEILGSDLDFNPTITPILDLSNISKGARKISGILGYERAINLGNAINNDRYARMQDIGIQRPASNNVYQFTQNNYSPKALSRMDIYRQTKNQFSSFERMAQV